MYKHQSQSKYPISLTYAISRKYDIYGIARQDIYTLQKGWCRINMDIDTLCKVIDCAQVHVHHFSRGAVDTVIEASLTNSSKDLYG